MCAAACCLPCKHTHIKICMAHLKYIRTHSLTTRAHILVYQSRRVISFYYFFHYMTGGHAHIYTIFLRSFCRICNIITFKNNPPQIRERKKGARISHFSARFTCFRSLLGYLLCQLFAHMHQTAAFCFAVGMNEHGCN